MSYDKGDRAKLNILNESLYHIDTGYSSVSSIKSRVHFSHSSGQIEHGDWSSTVHDNSTFWKSFVILYEEYYSQEMLFTFRRALELFSVMVVRCFDFIGLICIIFK